MANIREKYEKQHRKIGRPKLRWRPWSDVIRKDMEKQVKIEEA